MRRISGKLTGSTMLLTLALGCNPEQAVRPRSPAFEVTTTAAPTLVLHVVAPSDRPRDRPRARRSLRVDRHDRALEPQALRVPARHRPESLDLPARTARSGPTWLSPHRSHVPDRRRARESVPDDPGSQRMLRH